jgi:hypothetical protein
MTDRTDLAAPKRQAVAQQPLENTAGESMMNFVAQALTDPAIDANKLEVLLRIQRDVVADAGVRQFTMALHEAQMEMPRVQKNGTITLGGKGSIPFATWEDVDAILRPIMRKHGFSMSFTMETNPTGGFIVHGTLAHSAGHSKAYSMPLPNDAGPGRNALQAAGSTLSYGKRYLAEMMFNIVRTGQDDDGRAGGGGGVIDPDQKEELVGLMAERGADTKRFLAFFQIATLDDLLAADFDRAKTMVMAKKKEPQA